MWRPDPSFSNELCVITDALAKLSRRLERLNESNKSGSPPDVSGLPQNGEVEVVTCGDEMYAVGADSDASTFSLPQCPMPSPSLPESVPPKLTQVPLSEEADALRENGKVADSQSGLPDVDEGPEASMVFGVSETSLGIPGRMSEQDVVVVKSTASSAKEPLQAAQSTTTASSRRKLSMFSVRAVSEKHTMTLRPMWTTAVELPTLVSVNAKYHIAPVQPELSTTDNFRFLKTSTKVLGQTRSTTNQHGGAFRPSSSEASMVARMLHHKSRCSIVCRSTNLIQVMNPTGYTRAVWTALSMGFIAYDILAIPMQAFDIGQSGAFVSFEWIATFFWSIDLILWFRTGYFVGSHMEMRPAQIIYHYLKTWFIVDFVVVIMEWVSRAASIFSNASLLRSSRILRMLRMMKLIRLVKIQGYWSGLTEQINSNVIHLLCTMIVLAVVLMVLLHYVCCMWYALGDDAHDGWVKKDSYEGEKNTVFWYVASLRWAIAQLNGRTDIDDTRNMKERFFACVVGVSLAVFAQAIFISVITKTMLDLSELVSEKTRVRRLVNGYLDNHPVLPLLNSRVKRYMNDYQDANKEQEDEKVVLAILPKHLQAQLLFEVRSPVLVAHPLFSRMGEDFDWFMRVACRDIVRLTTAVKKYEVVFDKGDECSQMLYLEKVVGIYGDPSLIDRESVESGSGAGSAYGSTVWGTHVTPRLSTLPEPASKDQHGLEGHMGTKIRAGRWISEPAMWCEWRNRGRLVAANHGYMYTIDCADLGECLSNHPDASALCVLYAKVYLDELNTWDFISDVSDIRMQFSDIDCPIQLTITIKSAQRLFDAGLLSENSDLYCVCKIQHYNNARFFDPVFSTRTITDCLEPVWNNEQMTNISQGQSLVFELCESRLRESLPDRVLAEANLEPHIFLPDGFEGDLELHTVSRGRETQGLLSVSVVVADMVLTTQSMCSGLSVDGY